MPPAPIKISACFWQEYLGSQRAKLPDLPDIEHVSDRVIRVMGGNPSPMTLQGTNTYLVGTGRSRILIDTAMGKQMWIESLSKVLDQQNLEISHVLLTHWHGDHVGGIPDLISRYPTLANRIYKHQPDPGQHAIEDGQIFETEGATLKAVHTPGHAFDHISLDFDEEDALFTGDNVLGHGNSVAEDLGTYMNSLEIMKDLDRRFGYPAHGIPIEDLPKKLQDSLRAKTMRERQIHKALSQYRDANDHVAKPMQSLTTEELVQRMYGSVPDEAYELAIEPFVTETLWKLAEDRKVGFENAGGNRRWFANQSTAAVAV